MPPKRRIAKGRRSALTAEQATELLGGRVYFSFRWGMAPEATAERTRSEAWKAHRDDLLHYWLGGWDDLPAGWNPFWAIGWSTKVTLGGPGTRPVAWWVYDAPTAFRSRVDESGQLVTSVWPDIPPGRARYPAEPRAYDLQLPTPPDCRGLWESEAAYLERHGLLLPGERERLTAEDFAPGPYVRPEPEPDDYLESPLESASASPWEPDNDGESWRGV